MEPTKLPDPDAEALLRSLDIELSTRRNLRKPENRDRTAFRIGSIVILVAGMLLALWALQIFISQVPRPTNPAATEAATEPGR